MNSYYPVFLNIKGKKCLVVGGGQVALRKVETLLEHGAEVLVISPQISQELKALSKEGKVNATLRSYQPGDLQGAMVVIAATDDNRINSAVAAEARAKGILVNVVDDANQSDFIVPSCVTRGDLTIAVSTSGKSPALARKLRAKIESDLAEEYAALILLVEEVRQDMLKQGVRFDSSAWQEALDLDLLMGLLKNGETGKAREALLNSLQARRA